MNEPLSMHFHRKIHSKKTHQNEVQQNENQAEKPNTSHQNDRELVKLRIIQILNLLSKTLTVSKVF